MKYNICLYEPRFGIYVKEEIIYFFTEEGYHLRELVQEEFSRSVSTIDDRLGAYDIFCSYLYFAHKRVSLNETNT